MKWLFIISLTSVPLAIAFTAPLTLPHSTARYLTDSLRSLQFDDRKPFGYRYTPYSKTHRYERAYIQTKPYYHGVRQTYLNSKSPLFFANDKLGREKSRHFIQPRRFSKKIQRYLKRQERINVVRRRPLGRIFTSLCKCIIILTTTFVMKILNRTHLHDPKNNLQKFVSRRDHDIGLLTISNHCSILDDPGLWCGSLPMKQLTLENIRNIIMVEESYNCWGKISSSILHGLNCLPIKRGDIRGLESPQLFQLYKRLNGMANYIDDKEKKREWCHIMIEGRILQPWRYELPLGNSLPQLGKFRLGAAKLISTSPPSKLIVIPIYHYGMHNLFPETPPEDRYRVDASGSVSATRISGKTKLRFPRCGNRVDIYVGEPIDFKDLVPEHGYSFNMPTDKSLLHDINLRLRDAMLDLEAKASRDRISKRKGNERRASKKGSTQLIAL